MLKNILFCSKTQLSLAKLLRSFSSQSPLYLQLSNITQQTREKNLDFLEKFKRELKKKPPNEQFIRELGYTVSVSRIIYSETATFLQETFENYENLWEFWLEVSEFLHKYQKIQLIKDLKRKINKSSFTKPQKLKILNFLLINQLFIRENQLLLFVKSETLLKDYAELLDFLEDSQENVASNEFSALSLNTLHAFSVQIHSNRVFFNEKKSEILAIFARVWTISLRKDEKLLEKISNFRLMGLLSTLDFLLSRGNAEELVQILGIYRQMIAQLLARIRESLVLPGELSFLFTNLLTNQQDFATERRENREFLQEIHREILENYHLMKLSRKMQPFSWKFYEVFAQLPTLLRWSRLIRFENRSFFEDLERLLRLPAAKVRETAKYISVFLEFANETSANRENFSIKAEEIREILALVRRNMQKPEAELLTLEILLGCLKAIRGFRLENEAEMRGFEEKLLVSSLEKLEKSFKIVQFEEIARCFLRICEESHEDFAQVWRLFENSIEKVQSYHYIYLLQVLILEQTLQNFGKTLKKARFSQENSAEDQENQGKSYKNLKIFYQRCFNLVAILQCNFLKVFHSVKMRNREVFARNLKNFLVKHRKTLVSEAKIMKLEEYEKITAISTQKADFLKENPSFPLIFPLFLATCREEMQRIMEKFEGNPQISKTFAEKLRYFAILQNILELSSNFPEETAHKVNEFYAKTLAKVAETVDFPEKITVFCRVFSKKSFRNELNSESPAIKLAISLLKSRKYRESSEKPAKLLYLLRVLSEKNVQEQELFSEILEFLREKQQNFKFWDYISLNNFEKFAKNRENSLSSAEKPAKPLKTLGKSLKTFYEALDPMRLNGKIAYSSIMLTPLKVLDAKALFSLENVLARDVCSLDLEKHAHLLEKFDYEGYTALKYAISFEKTHVNEFFSMFSQQLLDKTHENAWKKAFSYLLEKGFLDLSQFFGFFQGNHKLFFENFPSFSVEMLSLAVEHAENAEFVEKIADFEEILVGLAGNREFSSASSEKLRVCALLSVISRENSKQWLQKCLEIDFSRDFSVNFLFRVPRLLLKSKEISQDLREIVRKAFEFLKKSVENDAKNDENPRSLGKFLEFLQELRSLKQQNREFLDKIFAETLSSAQFLEKNLQKLDDGPLLWRSYGFFVEMAGSSKEKCDFLKVFRRKVLKSAAFPGDFKELAAFLDVFAGKSSPDSKILSVLERNLWRIFKRNDDELKEIYLLFVEKQLGSEFFLEKLEEKLFKREKLQEMAKEIAK